MKVEETALLSAWIQGYMYITVLTSVICLRARGAQAGHHGEKKATKLSLSSDAPYFSQSKGCGAQGKKKCLPSDKTSPVVVYTFSRAPAPYWVFSNEDVVANKWSQYTPPRWDIPLGRILVLSERLWRHVWFQNQVLRDSIRWDESGDLHVSFRHNFAYEGTIKRGTTIKWDENASVHLMIGNNNDRYSRRSINTSHLFVCLQVR